MQKLPSLLFYFNLRAMFFLTYLYLLQFLPLSPLTELCGQNTPWSLVVDHTLSSSGTLSSLEFHPSLPPLIPVDAPPSILCGSSSPRSALASISPSFVLSHTSSSIAAPPRLLRSTAPRHRVSSAPDHHLRHAAVTISFSTAPIAVPILPRHGAPLALRPILLGSTTVHGRTTSHLSDGSQQSGPWARALTSPPPHTHTRWRPSSTPQEFACKIGGHAGDNIWSSYA